MFSVLTSKIFGGVAVALAAALAFTVITYEAKIGVYNNQLRKADGQITGLQADVAALRSNNAQLDAGVKQCNASIDALASVAKVVSNNGAVAVKAAQANRSEVTERIETIKLTPVNTCDDVKALLKKGGQ